MAAARQRVTGTKRSLRELPAASASARWMLHFLLGFVVLALPFIPGLRDVAGDVLVRVLCAFLFFFTGALSRQIGRLEAHTVELAELLDDLARERYGESYYAVRQTVPFLIEQLRTQPEAARRTVGEALKGLTRQNFGADADRWEEWWVQNRASFATPGSASTRETRPVSQRGKN